MPPLISLCGNYIKIGRAVDVRIFCATGSLSLRCAGCGSFYRYEITEPKVIGLAGYPEKPIPMILDCDGLLHPVGA